MADRKWSINARKPAPPHQRPVDSPKRPLESNTASSTPRPDATSQQTRGSNSPEGRRQQASSLKSFPSRPCTPTSSRRPPFPKPTPAPPPERAKVFGDLASEADNDSSSDSVQYVATVAKRKQNDQTAYPTTESKRSRTDHAIDKSRICLTTEKETARWPDASTSSGEPSNKGKRMDDVLTALSSVLERLSNCDAILEQKATLKEVCEFVDISELADREHLVSRFKQVEASIQDLAALDLRNWQREDPRKLSVDFEQKLHGFDEALAALRQEIEAKTSTQDASQKGLKENFQKLEKYMRHEIAGLHHKMKDTMKANALEFDDKIQKVQQAFVQANLDTKKETMSQPSGLENSSQPHWTTIDEKLKTNSSQIAALETRVSEAECLPSKETIQEIIDEKNTQLRAYTRNNISDLVKRVDTAILKAEEEVPAKSTATIEPVSRRLNEEKERVSKLDGRVHAVEGRLSQLEADTKKPPTKPRHQALMESPEIREILNNASNLNNRVDRLEAGAREDWQALNEARGRIKELEDRDKDRGGQVADYELRIRELNTSVTELQEDSKKLSDQLRSSNEKHKGFKAETVKHGNKLNEKINGSDGDIGILARMQQLEKKLDEVAATVERMNECSKFGFEASRKNPKIQDADYGDNTVAQPGTLSESGQDKIENEPRQNTTNIDQLTLKLDDLEAKQAEFDVQTQKVEQLSTSMTSLNSEHTTLKNRVDEADASIGRLVTDVNDYRIHLPELRERVEELFQPMKTADGLSQSLGNMVWNELGDDYFAQISEDAELDAFLGKLRYMLENTVTNMGTMQRSITRSDEAIEALRESNNDSVIDSIPLAVLNSLKAYVEKCVAVCVQEFIEKRIHEYIHMSVTTVADGMKDVYEREGINRASCLKHARDIHDNTTSITQHTEDIKKLQNAFYRLPPVLSNPLFLSPNDLITTLYHQCYDPNYMPQPRPPHMHVPQMIPKARQAAPAPSTPPVTPQEARLPSPPMVYPGLIGQQPQRLQNQAQQQRPTPETIAQNIILQPAYPLPPSMSQAHMHTAHLQQHQTQANTQQLQQQGQASRPRQRRSVRSSPQQPPVAQMLPSNENAIGSAENTIHVPGAGFEA